jgi:hypothetical protein
MPGCRAGSQLQILRPSDGGTTLGRGWTPPRPRGARRHSAPRRRKAIPGPRPARPRSRPSPPMRPTRLSRPIRRIHRRRTTPPREPTHPTRRTSPRSPLTVPRTRRRRTRRRSSREAGGQSGRPLCAEPAASIGWRCGGPDGSVRLAVVVSEVIRPSGRCGRSGGGRRGTLALGGRRGAIRAGGSPPGVPGPGLGGRGAVVTVTRVSNLNGRHCRRLRGLEEAAQHRDRDGAQDHRHHKNQRGLVANRVLHARSSAASCPEVSGR